MKAFFAAAVLFTSMTGFAESSAEKFFGTYEKIKKLYGETSCFESFAIKKDSDSTVGFYTPNTSDEPIINAELNGIPRKSKGSHGEAFSAREGEDTVTLENGILTFKYHGTTTSKYLPELEFVSVEDETIAVELKGTALLLARITSEKDGHGEIASEGKALCEYIKK